MRWRSPAEIAFRLRQEARNLALFARPPKVPAGTKARAPFPDPEPSLTALRSTRTAAAIIALADEVLLHRFPLLGLEVDGGPQIQWRRDYVNGKESDPIYFRKIPYLDAAVVGDHKMIWELNRHQHLVLLAQAYRLTGKREYLDEISTQLDSWFQANPPQCGINWSSALEVAFRALSWMWVDHLAGKDLGSDRRPRLIEGLYRHGLHLEANLSVYFSPNTHLLGEAVALHALGLMFASQRWQQLGAQLVNQEMTRQIRADGSHFEQSSYYHVYALDMFLFHAILAPPSEPYRASLERMAVYLDAVMSPSRSIPFIGDDDGGRFFHPYGPRDRFGSATLAACGDFLNHPEWICAAEDLHPLAFWWLGPAELPVGSERKERTSTHFPDSGIVVMESGDVHCIVDAGPFGPFRGGHSHADTLSIVARANGRELLIDPGTFTYAGDSPWRDKFRGTSAHNTVRIAGLDQADPAGQFGWKNPPQVEISDWQTNAAADFLDASCRYRGFRHRRRVFFLKPELLFILDEIEGPEIDAEQFWHLGNDARAVAPGCFRIAGAGTLLLDGEGKLSEAGDSGWRSRAYGVKEASPLVTSIRTGTANVRFGAVLAFSPLAQEATLSVTGSTEKVTMSLDGAWNRSIEFPPTGMPRYLPG